ncbi:MAG TPA: DNA methyltransferase [Ktedonobacterales bacterium]|nr:DNA methyltransferase [Ktedonobacterales bacterium]
MPTSTMSYATARKRGANSDINKLYPEDRAIHEWYRFVLSFPPHLVREYLERFGAGPGHRVLDPFCGTGTVSVEARKLGIQSIGIEAHPMATFASQVKVDWQPDPDGLVLHANRVADIALAQLRAVDIEDTPQTDNAEILHSARIPHGRLSKLRTLTPEKMELLLSNSISPLPLHKTLILLDAIEQERDERYCRHELLALAKAVVFASSNLHFGPEVGVGSIKSDAPVIASWLAGIEAMASDLRTVIDYAVAPAVIYRADARQLARVLEPRSIDVVITSPPYPNEKEYTRTTRLESVLLGFLQNKDDLRAIKRGLVRSNTRNIYKGDNDSHWVTHHAGIQKIADSIEARRIELGKTSGFERLYASVTRNYFGGMARHLAALRPMLRTGARLAYVVGDQASFLRVMIPTGEILADISRSLGYEVESIDHFRTRVSTVTKSSLREEVILLRWPGARRQSYSTHPLSL